MFIREQLIRSIYDLKPGFDDVELLDAYINSPRTCRWQNWTFKPGYYVTPQPRPETPARNPGQLQ